MICTSKDLEKFSAEAKEEIGENKVNLAEYVQKVELLLAEKYPDLRVPPGEIGEIVERCLRGRKFDCLQAAAQVHSFFKYLFDCRKLHGDMYFLPSIQKEYFYDSLGISVLKNRDSKGCLVFLARMELMPSKTYNLDKAIAACIMALDEGTRCSVDTQRLGVVYVCDFKGYGFGHAKWFTLSRIKLIAQMIQGTIPVRFKGFHVVRSPLLFTYTYALLKPFLKEKIRKRVHFHSHDLSEFHKEVSPDILPEYLGGKIPDDEYADLDMIRDLCSKDNYYRELFRYGYFAEDENENH